MPSPFSLFLDKMMIKVTWIHANNTHWTKGSTKEARMEKG
jgi:hypothetical protein